MFFAQPMAVKRGVEYRVLVQAHRLIWLLAICRSVGHYVDWTFWMPLRVGLQVLVGYLIQCCLLHTMAVQPGRPKSLLFLLLESLALPRCHRHLFLTVRVCFP